MSAQTEICKFCKQVADLEHYLIWDLGDIGTWCGNCNLGQEVVTRSVHIADIVQRRDRLMENLPDTRPALDKLNEMLNDRFVRDFRA
jgi:hypothetical protein